MKKLVILASGSGTNAENIIRYFKDSEDIRVDCVISNKEDAYVHERAKQLNIPSIYFKNADFRNDTVLKYLKDLDADVIVLAGFLLKIQPAIVKAFDNRIINIHPSLLPNYGGNGMYGANVHRAVIENKEQVSGITIHLVNEVYDDGEILHQSTCPVHSDDTPESLAKKVHELEHEHFPKVIESYIASNL